LKVQKEKGKLKYIPYEWRGYKPETDQQDEIDQEINRLRAIPGTTVQIGSRKYNPEVTLKVN